MSAAAIPQAGRPARTLQTRELHHRREPSRVNVSDTERWLSLLGGGALALLGLSRRSLPGLGLAAVGGSLLYRGATGHCSLYNALGVNTAEPRGAATVIPAGHGFKVEESVLVNRPATDLYRYWRNFENLGRFMQYLESVTVTGNRSHWVTRGPLGKRVEWDAEIITERDNELIGWRSLPGGDIETAGSVHFRPQSHDRGTLVHVSLKYDPPGGKAGGVIAGLFGRSPESIIREDLRRFKRVMETGEIPTVQGQPQGTCR
jgi:uncharacterized membrane protein